MDLYATELMGAKTYDVAGNYVGRVREFFIEPAEAPNRVSHYLLSRGHFQPLVAKHDQVASVAAGKMELSVSERALELYHPNESWLAVQKDLLDQQIIDTRGRKVVRVNDVDLTPFRTNGNVELRLSQVDVGLPGAVRRLLQGVVPHAVVRKLQSMGIDVSRLKINMDWQHLIMNGENLAEYAELLAMEGLLGHQHANSGWGTFDDDNMVGATAFMETLELALELRRAGYGENGERLGFDLYPYTEDQVAAVKRSVLQWRFIDGVAAKIDEPALRAAQAEKDAVRAYEVVYAALGA